jgi:hypothetical protein
MRSGIPLSINALRKVECANEATLEEVVFVFHLQHFVLIGEGHFPAAAAACIEQWLGGERVASTLQGRRGCESGPRSWTEFRSKSADRWQAEESKQNRQIAGKLKSQSKVRTLAAGILRSDDLSHAVISPVGDCRPAPRIRITPLLIKATP